jgi:hypothetical protein
MMKQRFLLASACVGAATLSGALLALHGCSGSGDGTGEQDQHAIGSGTDTPVPVPVPSDGSSRPVSELPFVNAASNPQLLGELLDKPTALGETTALQVRLPPPTNPDLGGSLVRVIGDVNSPHVLFNSDALVRLGLLGKSPGPDFFTAFATLSSDELTKVQNNQRDLASGRFGQTTSESVLFAGRAATSRTSFPPIDPSQFLPGNLVAINRCAIRPVSTQQAWDQSLFIRSPQVVLDPARTWDPCSGAGTQGGVWTFAHLMREMSIGSGKTPEDFVKDWLSNWLNTYTVNNDPVPARTQMFNQVIQPWETASGGVATLVTDPVTGVRSVNLTRPLNLNIAPYRLLAIVNRIDLGTTTGGGGGGGYGHVTGTPVTAGELRFIFGVVQPNPWGGGNDNTCGKKLFTTIFEYGVPRTGCAAVVNWAQQWSALQAFPGFTPAYLAQLQGMTESVVLHGKAPTKGNQNAINQIRTNEIQLQFPTWELREFTLTNEQPAANIDPPANGPLRTHTVAQTTPENVFNPLGPDINISNFVNGPVTAGLQLPVAVPNRCDSSYTVPFFVPNNIRFRAGNAFTSGPVFADFWKANVPATPNGICARHTFSLNTCHGCHRADSGTNGLGGSTNFVHADPLSTIPVTISKFLTGGGPGMTFFVNDTQFGAPAWPFADLDRRLQRLFDLSHCTPCTRVFPMLPKLVDMMQDFGPIPADVDPRDFPNLRVGPITDLAIVQKVVDLRAQFAGAVRDEPVDVIRAVDSSVE